jgi:HEPN domain-containing protein
MRRAAREWVRKAESDYRLAGQITSGSEPFHDQVCFLCQQSAEKYLKALLADLGLVIPRTHNLDDLLGLLRPHHASLGSLRRGLIFLTDFAVAVRYPGDRATKRQAASAQRWAGDVSRRLPRTPADSHGAASTEAAKVGTVNKRGRALEFVENDPGYTAQVPESESGNKFPHSKDVTRCADPIIRRPSNSHTLTPSYSAAFWQRPRTPAAPPPTTSRPGPASRSPTAAGRSMAP